MTLVSHYSYDFLRLGGIHPINCQIQNSENLRNPSWKSFWSTFKLSITLTFFRITRHNSTNTCLIKIFTLKTNPNSIKNKVRDYRWKIIDVALLFKSWLTASLKFLLKLRMMWGLISKWSRNRLSFCFMGVVKHNDIISIPLKSRYHGVLRLFSTWPKCEDVGVTGLLKELNIDWKEVGESEYW